MRAENVTEWSGDRLHRRCKSLRLVVADYLIGGSALVEQPTLIAFPKVYDLFNQLTAHLGGIVPFCIEEINRHAAQRTVTAGKRAENLVALQIVAVFVVDRRLAAIVLDGPRLLIAGQRQH